MTTTVMVNGVEYVGLLKKYMAWVAWNEGITFVTPSKPNTSGTHLDEFTDQEWAVLVKLDEAIAL